jgi:polyisoprenoid-binding protein YceI
MTNPEGMPATSPTAMLGSEAAAGEWQLDPDRSKVEFAVKHFWGLITVHGHFEKCTGAATVDPSGGVTATLTIDAESVQTRNKKRDNHLRSADFFNAAEHRSVMFTTTEVRPVGDNRLHVTGELVAAGTTQTVDLDVVLSDATTDHVNADATVTVDRTTFGMAWSPLGMAAATAIISLHLRFKRSAMPG